MRMIAILEADPHGYATGCLLHLFPARGIDGRGLFGKYGDAALRGFFRHQGMQIMGRAQVHRIQIFPIQHRPPVGPGGAPIALRPVRNDIG